MRVLGILLLLSLMACAKKEILVFQEPKLEPMCGPKVQSLINSISCSPSAVWKIKTRSEGFPKKIALRIKGNELFNSCEENEDGFVLTQENDSMILTFGFMWVPQKDENISVEIFNCEDGRRFAAADPALFTLSQNPSDRIYDVSCELIKD